DRRPSYQRKWGEHYRKEWSTPVKFKKVTLDTLAGGLTPYEAGGGRQSKTLRLRDKQAREYVLRSIDKSFGKALPEIYQGTFIENLINDQVTIGHPYAALVIPTLAEATGVYHTNPVIVFVPSQPALDTFNKDFGNKLYLFEQRPDENWETAPNFGNSKNIVGTEKLLTELIEDNDRRVDQLAYVRARLLDFLIGDWGRHEDQWRWASFKNSDETIYKPIPRDRDQAFTKFDGKWLKATLSAADLEHLQSFDKTIPDINTFNFPARNLDRRMANQTTLKQWTHIAKDMQRSLTDAVIEKAVKQLPPEVFNISGNEMITNLKSRRNLLEEYASTYYKFLAKDVDIVGSDKKELFQVNRVNNHETIVKVYQLKVMGDSADKLIYERKFLTPETREIRLYGLGDDDVFRLDGKTGDGILVRIVGGDGNDVLDDKSYVSGSRKLTQVYDTDKKGFQTSAETRLRISNDSVLNTYEYESFEYDKKGFGVSPGFFSLTLGWGETRHDWKKEPAGKEHSLKVKYSINRAAFYIDYKTTFYQLLGRWNAFVGAGAGVPKVVNFFGVGNETSFATYDRRFFRLRSQEYYGKLGINRVIGNSQLELAGFYQSVKIRLDSNRIISKFAHTGNGFADLSRKNFVGADLSYKYQNTDHPIVPSRGFRFISSATYTHNLNTPDHSFTRLSSDASVYIPLIKFISLGIRAGGAANMGDAEFYQLNMLGSHENLRGFRKYRFYGKQAFYNNNELRFMFNARNKVFNGKYGFVTFIDHGRVWYPGENSNKWHSAYGAGAFLSLFNKIVLSGAYGISKEDKVISMYIGFYF
ncbi:MAG TPA: BamA/TamA family outer membrane protein, partial [Chitinophagaceae bacterium]|nr:BamA/TamA family outer membrane protein [Chitinophagaceae bacterium]